MIYCPILPKKDGNVTRESLRKALDSITAKQKAGLPLRPKAHSRRHFNISDEPGHDVNEHKGAVEI